MLVLVTKKGFDRVEMRLQNYCRLEQYTSKTKAAEAPPRIRTCRRNDIIDDRSCSRIRLNHLPPPARKVGMSEPQNRILRSLPPDQLQRIMTAGELVELPTRRILYDV